VVGVDAMTYAATRQSLAALDTNPRFELAVVDVCDQEAMAAVFARAQARGGRASGRRNACGPFDR
jgi:dTDP-D-glucose 4,6-dehydratase